MELTRYQQKKLANPELLKQKRKERYAQNIEKERAYRDEHKEEQAMKRSQTFVCTCGDTIAKWSKPKHLKGKRHFDKV